jgi:5'-deoxynucleotidase YfbR-like HD superfamily hydrolase
MQPADLNKPAGDAVQLVRFARAGSRVQRYHTHGTSVPDTVGQHSHGVAMIVIAIVGRQRVTGLLLEAALCHDLAEHFLGDIPSPAKGAMDRPKLNAMEDDLLAKVGLSFELTHKQQAVLKLADILDGMWFCAEERCRGNRMLDEVFDVYKTYYIAKAEVFMLEWGNDDGCVTRADELYQAVLLQKALI